METGEYGLRVNDMPYDGAGMIVRLITALLGSLRITGSRRKRIDTFAGFTQGESTEKPVAELQARQRDEEESSSEPRDTLADVQAKIVLLHLVMQQHHRQSERKASIRDWALFFLAVAVAVVLHFL